MIQTPNNTSINTVDALYIKPNLAAIYLIKEGDDVALIDTGTHNSISQIQYQLEKRSVNWAHVKYIILTHIHLDHAGGASALMKLCPNASLVCHPLGARHMATPDALIASAMSVYGENRFKQMYGDISPINPARMIELDDNSTLTLGTRQLQFIDTPGHANHHYCIIDQQTNSIFTGDTLGISYPALNTHGQLFLFPSTTPTQFDPDALHQSIERVMSENPSTLYLTHYGAITPTPYLIAGLHEQIDDFVMLTQQVLDDDIIDKETALNQKITDYLLRRCLNNGCSLEPESIKKVLSMDAKLNTQGLLYWANKSP